MQASVDQPSAGSEDGNPMRNLEIEVTTARTPSDRYSRQKPVGNLVNC
jgi:hypothetical protein